jgi:hypothetical protein
LGKVFLKKKDKKKKARKQKKQKECKKQNEARFGALALL